MPPKDFKNKSIRRNPRVAWRMVGEEAVLVHLERNFYFTLDAVGSRIWQNLDSETSWDGLAAWAKKEYDGPEKAIESDLSRFIDQMAKENIILVG